MKITGIFQISIFQDETGRVGSFDCYQGHASIFSIDGNSILTETCEGILLAPHPITNPLGTAKTINSGTRNHTVTISPSQIITQPGQPTRITGRGTAEGTLRSILGGIACHTTHSIVQIASAEGRFGTFIGPKTIERYEAANTATNLHHRHQRQRRVDPSRHHHLRQAWLDHPSQLWHGLQS